jgi:hypothetical protein
MSEPQRPASPPAPDTSSAGRKAFDPEAGQLVHSVDRTAEIRAYSAANPVSEEAERAFIEARNDPDRFPFTEEMAKYLDELDTWGDVPITRWAELPPPPVQPGSRGHGTGIYFFPGTLPFHTWTRISYRVIVPSAAGGGVTGYLYLTASNRSRYGAEVFVEYHAYNPPTLEVYDLSQVDVPDGRPRQSLRDAAGLAEFFQPIEIGGRWFNSVRVVNETVRDPSSATHWSNRAYLEYPGGGLHRVYRQDYDLSPGKTQAADRIGGFWGPIIETFAAIIPPIYLMGFEAPTLAQDGESRTLIWTGRRATSNIALFLREYGLNTPNNLPNYGFWVE